MTTFVNTGDHHHHDLIVICGHFYNVHSTVPTKLIEIMKVKGERVLSLNNLLLLV